MKLESVYLLAGPETGRRASFVFDLRKVIAENDGSPAEEHRLYASETGIGELLAILRNGSLFSTRRLIEFRGAELVKGKDDVGELVRYIKSPAADAILVLETDLFYIEKGIEDAVGKPRKTTFFEMFENEKPRWIERKLREFDISIDEAGTNALLELVENDSAALDSACTRLSLLFPAGSRLGESEVEAAIARSRREDAFSLFERISTEGLADALEVLDAVLADRRGDAVQIISALIWNFRRLHRLHLLVESGEPFESACMKLQIRSKTVQRQSSTAIRRYSRMDCERIIRLASEFDGRARALGAVFERDLLQLLVCGIMESKGRLNLASTLETVFQQG
ncbi:MAG: DNA polymerase III subunit delta [Rectinemataceae bacterium]